MEEPHASTDIAFLPSNLFELLPVGLLRIEHGDVVGANEFLSRLLGHADAKELYGRSFVDLISDPEDGHALERTSTHLHGPLTANVKLVRSDGGVLDAWVTLMPRPEQSAILEAVVEPVAGARGPASTAWQRLFQEAAERLDIGLAVGLREGATRSRLAFVNDAATRILARSRAELLKINAADILSDAEWSRLTEVFSEESTTARRFETEALRPDGSRTRVQVGLASYELGSQPAFLAVFQSLEERQRLEEGASTLIDELEQQTALLEEFKQGVSHDLRAPLNTITKLIEKVLMRDAETLNAEVTELLTIVHRTALSAYEMLETLLAHARRAPEPPEVEAVDTNAVVRHAISDLQATIEGCAAVVEVSDLPSVRADPVQLRRVFENLLINAVRHGRDGPPRIVIGAEKRDSLVCLRVEDRGPGVDPADAEAIFEMHRRGRGGSRVGSGLGLALCKRIVERQGGRIWVEPRPGGGARFCFTLPSGGGRP